MYICICRTITDSQIKGFLDKTPSLCKEWAVVSKQISGEPINCGKCTEMGQDIIDSHPCTLQTLIPAAE